MNSVMWWIWRHSYRPAVFVSLAAVVELRRVLECSKLSVGS